MTTKTTFNSWITCPQPNPQAKIRLFCLPYAGASAMIFRTWAKNLPATIEVCPIEIPGRGRQMKTPPYTKMQPLVTDIAENIIPFLDKPFAIFGHSMGGLVSFELARLLRSDYNLQPLHLFISARNSPQVKQTQRLIYNLSDDEFWQEIRKFNDTPDDVMDNPEIINLFLPIIRADFTVLDTYVYSEQQPFNFPISVFGGLQDATFADYELEGWQGHTSVDFHLEKFDGNHFFMTSLETLVLKNIAQKLENVM